MKKLKKIFKEIGFRQAMLYILATILLIISIWFIIANSVFLIKNLNRAFGGEQIPTQEIEQFDKKGFQKLNLLTER